jgi:hypothetical protein
MDMSILSSYFAITVVTMIVGAIITAAVDATHAEVGRPIPQH